MSATLSPHLETLVRIAKAAGTVVMRHYEAGCDARVKADRSPVTDAADQQGGEFDFGHAKFFIHADSMTSQWLANG